MLVEGLEIDKNRRGISYICDKKERKKWILDEY